MIDRVRNFALIGPERLQMIIAQDWRSGNSRSEGSGETGREGVPQTR